MVTFTDCAPPATPAQVADLEARLGFRLPDGLRRLFLEANGARPSPILSTDAKPHHDPWDCVSACLELREGRGGALWYYQLTVLKQRLVPASFFPFAHVLGGDLFFVDCASSDAQVYVHLHDTAFEPIEALGISFDDFWKRLEAVEEQRQRAAG